MNSRIEINKEQARDFMLLIEDRLIDIQHGHNMQMAPATISRLSRTYDYLQDFLAEDTEDAET